MSDSSRGSDELGDRLRAARPQLDDLGAARVRDQVLLRLTVRSRPERRTPMVVVLLLSLGLIFTGGGAAMAISGLSSDTTAVDAQYGPPPSTPNPGVSPPAPDSSVGGAGGTDTAPTPTTTVTTPDDDSTLGGESEEADTPEAVRGPNQIVAADASGSLPFTGFAAIPIVLVGSLLIAAGTLLRRRTS